MYEQFEVIVIQMHISIFFWDKLLVFVKSKNLLTFLKDNV